MGCLASLHDMFADFHRAAFGASEKNERFADPPRNWIHDLAAMNYFDSKAQAELLSQITRR